MPLDNEGGPCKGGNFDARAGSVPKNQDVSFTKDGTASVVNIEVSSHPCTG